METVKSINNSMGKIKSLINKCIESEKGKDILTVAIVILVGLGSFGLGRLSKQASSPGIKIEYTGQESNVVASEAVNPYNSSNTPNISQKTQETISGNYFASNRGQKYYPVGCSAGKTIKQENRIYYATSAEAEKAGYTLSSSCK